MPRGRGPIQVDVTADVYPEEVLGAVSTEDLIAELMKRWQQEPHAAKEVVDGLRLPPHLREQLSDFLNQPIADQKALDRWKQAVAAATGAGEAA